MPGQKVVILDGSGSLDGDLAPVLEELLEVFRRQGSEIQLFRLRELRLAHCLGCFGCWLKTPGMCVEDDEGRRVARAVVQSEATVFFTPVTFGGYSPELKKMMDRFIQLISPYFRSEHGELHHPPRYRRRPRLMMAGVQRRPDSEEAHLFRILAGRNAINFHPPSYAAEVVVATDPPDRLQSRFESLLVRSDVLPFGDSVASLMPPVDSGVAAGPDSPRRALLVVGSPRTGSLTTSAILGSYFLERLEGYGWETESLTLRANLGREDGQAALLASIRHATLILLVFPLYSDALPYLVTKALAVIAADRRANGPAPPQRLLAIVNSGFPETHQNAVALAICRQFASQSGIAWAGGLALAGGGIVGGQPLNAVKRTGLPVEHVVRSLDLTAAAISEGRPVPPEAAGWMAASPLPHMPFALYRRIFSHFAAKGFEREAAANGVAKERLLDQPYAV